ncbi:MAG: 16S rRNA (adenine(1518)-N(6)/adenine(1519)-N(6))-dimethyltransferase RsmA, partial [Anaerovoracaceae bacterium]|nr:16S rRNA (adenine(1518)-N(6)/adenine(1519)-N(6))-dimethyltransferase RsmA [Anaerovoracaceae bacterium]
IIEGADIKPDDTVIEIGPGMGVITREAAERAARVIAIELDKTLIPVLSDTLSGLDNVQIINQDILKTDINELIGGEKAENVKIIGNLPYYITTPIIIKLLEENIRADSLVIMTQKEVADRINAGPGSKAYGALSVTVQFYCLTEKITDVGRECFVPSPKVDSAVLKLTFRKEPPVELRNRDIFFECVRAGFGQRRKTLSNSLQTLHGTDREMIRDSLDAAGIDPARRAETLSIEEFARISDEVDKRL